MQTSVTAAASGQFTIGKYTVNRLGFGAMRIVGEGVWGDPKDPIAARETLGRLRELGVNLVDTADSYGPFVSEDLLREVLYPYDGMLIATKGGFTRPDPGVWSTVGKPEYLRQCVQMSLRRLGVKSIGLWQLHRIDSDTPREKQFEAIAQFLEEGLVENVGLSEVSIEEIEAARRYFPVVTVQNLYNLTERKSEDVLEYCERENIGFIPWFPLAAGDLANDGSAFAEIARKVDATPSQLALAWLLHRSKVMLPIPGTGNPHHLEENVAAAAIKLSNEDFAAIDEQSRAHK